jgi:hypothetical protein
MYKYKNRTDRDLVVIGVGEVKAGAEFETDEIIEGPNFQALSTSETPRDLPPRPELPQTAPLEQLPATTNEGIIE